MTGKSPGEESADTDRSPLSIPEEVHEAAEAAQQEGFETKNVTNLERLVSRFLAVRDALLRLPGLRWLQPRPPQNQLLKGPEEALEQTVPEPVDDTRQAFNEVMQALVEETDHPALATRPDQFRNAIWSLQMAIDEEFFPDNVVRAFQSLFTSAAQHPHLRGEHNLMFLQVSKGSYKIVDNSNDFPIHVDGQFDDLFEVLDDMKAEDIPQLHRSLGLLSQRVHNPFVTQADAGLRVLQGLILEGVRSLLQTRIKQLRILPQVKSGPHQRLVTVQELASMPESWCPPLLAFCAEGLFEDDGPRNVSLLDPEALEKQFQEAYSWRLGMMKDQDENTAISGHRVTKSMPEKKIERALRIVHPPNFLETDVLNDLHYVIGLIASSSAGLDQNMLDVLATHNLRELLLVKSAHIGDREEYRNLVEFLAVPASPLLTQEDRLQAVINRDLFLFRPVEKDSYPERERVIGDLMTPREYWWIYWTLEQALIEEDSVEAILQRVFPGIAVDKLKIPYFAPETADASFLPHATPFDLRDRFERLGRMAGLFFQEEGHTHHSSLIQGFFMRLAGRTPEEFDEGTMKAYQNIARFLSQNSQHPEKEAWQKELRDEWEKDLCGPKAKDIVLNPELATRIGKRLSHWRRIDGLVRIKHRQHITKVHPHLFDRVGNWRTLDIQDLPKRPGADKRTHRVLSFDHGTVGEVVWKNL